MGVATKSLLFTPNTQAGWDPGFHSLDVYKWRLEQVPFYNTTRPYSELSYIIGSKIEQVIEVFHTQNIRPHWNAQFRYRLTNSPGFVKNLKSNHNNYLVTSWYQSVNKRYNNFFVILANHLQAGENGGLRSDTNYLDDPVYKDRYNIPTKIGGEPEFGRDFFSTSINTGNRYREFKALLRQQYDLGRKDSIVNDSSVIPLFYPRLRFEHTIQYNTYKYQFIDYYEPGTNSPDSSYYFDSYNLQIPFNDSFNFRDFWKELVNDFSIYTFPDANNLQQYFKVGAGLQNLTGYFLQGTSGQPNKSNFYNFFGHAEYRNRTRNLKWDIEAYGKLYFTGFNAGNYQVRGSLSRNFGRRLGNLALGFENVNRTPSFLFDSRSSFYLEPQSVDFGNENTSHFFGVINNPWLKLNLSAHYYLISNYTYFTEFYKPQQEEALFTFLRIGAQKVFRIGRYWNWYADLFLQQKTGNVQLNTPQVFTRQRIAFEGHFFKNLNVSTGLEMRYHTPYNADNYSPIHGQFFYDDSTRISNLPDISLFLHFRIRSFRIYSRLENLNTIDDQDGISFTNNNFAARNYPTPGLWFRIGIYWGFIN